MTVAAPPHNPSPEERQACSDGGVGLKADELETLWQVAERRVFKGQLDQGLAVLKALALEQPDDPGVYITLGRLYQLRRSPADARTCYAHALTLAPDEPEASCNLGELVWQLDGDADAARVLLKRVIERAPESPAAGRASAVMRLVG